MKILMIDGEQVMRDSLARALKEAGYSVLAAQTEARR